MQKWLYDISERIEALQAVLDEQDNESIAPDVKNAIQAIYESDVPAAVADGIEFIKKQKGFIDEIDKRIDELKALKDSRKKRLERVKQGYCDFLISVGKKKIETAYGKPVARTYERILTILTIYPTNTSARQLKLSRICGR